jgi:hypothetical protein
MRLKTIPCITAKRALSSMPPTKPVCPMRTERPIFVMPFSMRKKMIGCTDLVVPVPINNV